VRGAGGEGGVRGAGGEGGVDCVPLLVAAGEADPPALPDAAAGLDGAFVLDDPAGGDRFGSVAGSRCGAGVFGVGRGCGLEGVARAARRRRGRF
jgi:hypothetical protein